MMNGWSPRAYLRNLTFLFKNLETVNQNSVWGENTDVFTNCACTKKEFYAIAGHNSEEVLNNHEGKVKFRLRR